MLPLDCHDEIGTNASIVRAFHARVKKGFVQYGLGFAGRIGDIMPIGLDELVSKGKEFFSVERVEVGGAKPASITQVAIVAGGGDDVEYMEEAERLGAQVYISGEWYTRTMPPTYPADDGPRAIGPPAGRMQSHPRWPYWVFRTLLRSFSS